MRLDDLRDELTDCINRGRPTDYSVLVVLGDKEFFIDHVDDYIGDGTVRIYLEE